MLYVVYEVVVQLFSDVFNPIISGGLIMKESSGFGKVKKSILSNAKMQFDKFLQNQPQLSKREIYLLEQEIFGTVQDLGKQLTQQVFSIEESEEEKKQAKEEGYECRGKRKKKR